METFLNIVVPTRDRADTLCSTLATLVGQDYPNAKFIVSDNCSSDDTKEIVSSFADARIVYLRTPARLSMSENWEFALGKVTSGWVAFLGDDDGLFPNALTEIAQTIAEHSVEAISTRAATFMWPGHFDATPDGMLIQPPKTRDKLLDARKQLEKVLEGTAAYTELPWIYGGGLVSTTLIDRARDKHGRFFRTRIPDVCSAVALSSVCGKYVLSGTRFAVNGASRHSTGIATISLGTLGPGNPKEMFESESPISYESSLAEGYSLQLMIADAYLKTMDLRQESSPPDLTRFLDVAVSICGSNQREAVQMQCDETSLRNGIRKAHVRRLLVGRRSVRRYVGGAAYYRWNPRKEGVLDVSQAAEFLAAASGSARLNTGLRFVWDRALAVIRSGQTKLLGEHDPKDA